MTERGTVWRLVWASLTWSVGLRAFVTWLLSVVLLMAVLWAVTMSGPLTVQQLPGGGSGCESAAPALHGPAEWPERRC